jgi:hypothetical protein
MSIVVKWADEDNSAVYVSGEKSGYIPVGNKLWVDWGIDVLESADKIIPFKSEISDKRLKIELEWVNISLQMADIQVNLHADGDSRAKSTESEWRGYRRKLRDYIKDNCVEGDRPTPPN